MIIGVVLIHSYLGERAEYPFLDYIQNLFSQIIGRNGVPFFFFISSYLLFNKEREYIPTLKSRVKTLLIPFLFWTISVLLLFFVLQSIPALSSFFSGKMGEIADYSLYQYLNAIFGIDKSPLAYQFWFIRDLMKLIILFPIFSYLARKISYITLIILAGLWLAEVPTMPFFYSFEVVFFFYLGAFVNCKDLDLTALDKHHKTLLISYIPIALFAAYLYGKTGFDYQVARISVLLGLLAIWTNAQMFKKLKGLSCYAFAVFAMHEPALWGLKKIINRLVPVQNEIHGIIYYFLIPGFVVLLCLIVAKVLNKFMPRLFDMITGGRS